MIVGIFINTTKSEANTTANAFQGLLADNGISSKVVNLKEDCKDVDLIAVFGGDGTILRVIEYAIEYDVPILAINNGTVGFLTCVEGNELEKALNLIKNGGEIVKRSVIKIKTGDKKFYALNEATVQRQSVTCEVVKCEFTINENLIDNVIADGLIVSTPTGSTAYSLSAGGAIITPDLNAFIATPICAHSLHSRPIVFSDTSLVKIKILPRSAKSGLFVDGKHVKNLAVGETVTISKSKKTVKFYNSNDNFYQKLTAKLNSWGSLK